MLLTISAQTSGDKNLTAVLVTLAVLIVVVVVGGMAILVLRKRMFADGSEEFGGSLFEDLRRLRREGKISEVEFEYLRRCMAARAAGTEPPPRPAGLGEDTEVLVAPPGYDLTGAAIPPEVLDAMRRRQEGAE